MAMLTQQQASALQSQMGQSAEQARAAMIEKERKAIIESVPPGMEHLVVSGVKPVPADCRGRFMEHLVVSGVIVHGSEQERTILAAQREKVKKNPNGNTKRPMQP